jgi:hypothetical protein
VFPQALLLSLVKPSAGLCGRDSSTAIRNTAAFTAASSAISDICRTPVNGFFENGGNRLYIARVVGKGATTAQKTFGDFTIRAAGPGAWGRRIWIRIQDGSTVAADGTTGFRLRAAYWASVDASFRPYDPFDPKNNLRLPRPQHVEDFDNLFRGP